MIDVNDILSLKPEQIDHLKKFNDSPDAGDPSCICSYCKQVITEKEVPYRLWPKTNSILVNGEPISDFWEIRLHWNCLKKIVEGIIDVC